MPAEQPTTPFLDNFERDPENPLSWNGRWTGLRAGWERLRLYRTNCGGLVSGPPGYNFAASVWEPRSFNEDQEIHAVLAGSGACTPNAELGEGFRMFLRITNHGVSSTNGNFYQFLLHNTTGPDESRIGKLVNGTHTWLAVEDIGIGGCTRWSRVLFRAIGSTLEAYGTNNNWVTSDLIIQVTDTSITGGGRIGLGFEYNTSSFPPSYAGFGGGTYPGRTFVPQIIRPWDCKPCRRGR